LIAESHEFVDFGDDSVLFGKWWRAIGINLRSVRGTALCSMPVAIPITYCNTYFNFAWNPISDVTNVD